MVNRTADHYKKFGKLKTSISLVQGGSVGGGKKK